MNYLGVLSKNHSKSPWISIDPIKIETDNSIDFIASPVQNHEQMITHIKVNARINNDFFDTVCLIILFIFDIA